MRLNRYSRANGVRPYAASLLFFVLVLFAPGLQAQDPVISIRPSVDPQSQWGGIVISPLSVTIDYCHSTSLDASSRSVLLDGNLVTNLTYQPLFGGNPGCSGSVIYTSTGQLALTPGSHWLQVTICDYVPNCTTQSMEYTAGVVTPQVTVDGATDRVIEGTVHSRVFTVWNTGNVSGQLSIAVSCAGSAVAAGSCSTSSPASVTLGPNESHTVPVQYTAGAPNATGSVQVTAACSGCTPGTADVDVETIAATHGVVVSPATQTVEVPTATWDTVEFVVRNTGNVQDVYSFNVSCSGAAGSCTALTSTFSMPPGSAGTYRVRYQAGAAGTQGSISGTATRSGGGASASFSATVSSVPQTYGVAVTPDAQAVTAVAGAANTQAFTVRNTGNMPATYTITRSCTGAVISGGTCPLSQSTLSLAPGVSGSVYVRYTSGANGTTGTITAAAAGSGTPVAVSDGGAVAITAWALNAGYPGDSAGLARLERGACLTTPAGPGGAYECGDLRLAHPLPATRVLNKPRVPVLLYNSQTALPVPLLTTEFTPTAALSSVNVTVVVSTNAGSVMETTTFSGAQVSGWGTGQLRRVSAMAPAGLETGAYRYTMQVQAFYAGGATQTTAPRTGVLTVVNRRFSPFGAGWWMGGVEQVVSQGDSLKLWVGGDGSARIYRKVMTPANTWVADAFVRPDTLKLDAAANEYLRSLSGGVEVRYNAVTGLHSRTRNRQGHETRFTWTDGRLVSMSLTRMPNGTGGYSFDTGYAYTFGYMDDGSGLGPRLNAVRAPGPRTSGADTMRLVLVESDALGRVTGISDPNSWSRWTQYGYGLSFDALVRSRTDRRGFTTAYTYNEGSRLERVTSQAGSAAGDTVSTQFRAQESMGLPGTTGPVTPAASYTWINGPRAVADTAIFVLDRWGAPVRIRNTLGHETTVWRADPRFPGLATRTTQPGGLTSEAFHDARGNLLLSLVQDPLDDGHDAVTQHTYGDSRWPDFPTETVSPEGLVTRRSYDELARLVRTSVGTHGARQARYSYRPLGDLSAPGLVASVEMPDGTTETYEYDTRSNLSAVITPAGRRTEYLNDRIGRVERVRRTMGFGGPGPLLAHQSVDETTTYDLLDQPVHVETYAPEKTDSVYAPTRRTITTPAQRVYVDNTYDEEGNLLSVSRRGEPDYTLSVGTLTNGFRYDGLGRKILELAPDDTPNDWNDNPRDSIVYDAAGNVVRIRGRRFAEFAAVAADTLADIRMYYDVLNRLTMRITPRVQYGTRQALFDSYFQHPARAIAGDTAVFEYHPTTGRMTVARNRDARTVRSYYRGGMLQQEVQSIRNYASLDSTTHVYTVGFVYDLDGRRTEVTLPTQLRPSLTGTRTQYGYDSVTGDLTQITDALGNVFNAYYDMTGRMDMLQRPGSVWETFAYDADGNLTYNSVTGILGSSRSESYIYDNAGQLLIRWGNTDESQYRYSGLGHVVFSNNQEERVNPYALAREMEEIRLDALGNIERINSLRQNVASCPVHGTTNCSGPTTRPVRNYGYGTGVHRGRLLRIADPDDGRAVQRYTYDAAGNTIVSGDSLLRQGTFGLETRSYYDAENRLRAINTWDEHGNTWDQTSEEYRYDALGRRVLVRTQKMCSVAPADEPECASNGWIRRTVWDGDQELGEFRMWASFDLEYDGQDARPQPTVWPSSGVVVYTGGFRIDQPISVIRMGYAQTATYGTPNSLPPFAVIPLWDRTGTPVGGLYSNGYPTCVLGGPEPCVEMMWPGMFSPLAQWRATFEMVNISRRFWHGSLLENKRDGSGNLYRRNRYYDPMSGRFTQEDPIGLAGGLNLYGYANGNPVSYADPYGLCKRPQGLRKGEIGICIETFIAGPSAGVPSATADNRGFSATGGTYRTSDRFIVQSDGRVRDVSANVGKTFGFLPGIGIPTHVSATDGTQTAIFASVDSGTLSPWPPFNINYQFEITVEAGNVSIAGSHDGFPSYEVWVYEDGKAPRLIYGHRETNALDLRGCCDKEVKQ